MITVQDILKNANAYVGDTSTDRISDSDRFQAVTEATAWLLEELGNEHMVDRADIDYLPTVTWYKMDNLTPYLLTAGNLRFKNERSDRVDFTRLEPRDLATSSDSKYAYAIERYNDVSYMGIKAGNEGQYKDLVLLNKKDSLTYTGVNASDILKTDDSVRFNMTNTGAAASGLTTTTGPIDLTEYEGLAHIIFEVEIPDLTDVTSVSIKFGDDLSTDYWLGTATQDVNNNPLVVGVNTIAIPWPNLTVVGTPTIDSITVWSWAVNHQTSKPAVDGFSFSDTRVAKKIPLTFKYIFYRVGKDNTGDDIIEFGDTTDVPFFAERYPQYRFAVAHKTAAVLFRNQRLLEEARAEDRDAGNALTRFRKNFAGERDMSNSSFKIAGVSLRNKRIIRRR